MSQETATAMMVTTTHTVEGRPVQEYLGIVTGETILGANVFKDIRAGIRNVVGGRSGAYEGELRDARQIAIQEMIEEARDRRANAIIGVDVDYESVGQSNGMLMVTVAGTAVRL